MNNNKTTIALSASLWLLLVGLVISSEPTIIDAAIVVASGIFLLIAVYRLT